MILQTLKWTLDENILFGHYRESGFCRSLPISHIHPYIHACTLLSNSIQAVEHLASGKWLVGGRAEKGKTGRRKGFCQHQSRFSIYGAKILGFWFLFVCISVNVALDVSCDWNSLYLLFLSWAWVQDCQPAAPSQAVRVHWSSFLSGLCFLACVSVRALIPLSDMWTSGHNCFHFSFSTPGLLILVPASEWLKTVPCSAPLQQCPRLCPGCCMSFVVPVSAFAVVSGLTRLQNVCREL